MTYRIGLSVVATCLALTALLAPREIDAGPPGSGVEGPHSQIPGFSRNSCSACHGIVPGPTGPDAVRRPNETCFGCHTDGVPYPGRPKVPAVSNHDWIVTGSVRFMFGDFGAPWYNPLDAKEIHCTSCHDPHRTFDPTRGMTLNVMYIREHTDDYQLDATGRVIWFPAKELKVIDLTGPNPIEIDKQIDHDIVYTGIEDLANGNYTQDICSTCHTQTNHHRNDGTAPGGQSHFDGEKCILCHPHEVGFKPSCGVE